MSMHLVSSVKGIASLIVGMAISVGLAQATVQVAQHDEYGTHLVDGEGLSLYVFLSDAEAEGSACNAACAAAWPPLTTDAEVSAGEGVDQELLGTVERPDGSQQVTYDGWPLYHYLVDRRPGTTAGQALGDEWFLLAPDGTVIGADLQASDAGAAESDGADAGAQEEIDVEALMADGKGIYNSTCAGCHGANGDQVLATHVRRITESQETVSDAPALIRQIMYGGAYMPGFGNVLSNEQIQAVATYVRNSFGHDFGPVTGQEVITERERFN